MANKALSFNSNDGQKSLRKIVENKMQSVVSRFLAKACYWHCILIIAYTCVQTSTWLQG